MILNDNLKYGQESITYVGEHPMTVLIPKDYEKHKMLAVTDFVHALAIFEIIIEGESHGLFLPGVVDMYPSKVNFVTLNGIDYVKCEFSKGDIFIKNKKVVQNSNIAYILFVEYFRNGRLPHYVTYDMCAFLFDYIKKVTGVKLPAEHAIFEMIFSHLSRSADNLNVPYRCTDMSKPRKIIKLKDIPHATSSLTAKLIGGYLADSINASLVNANEEETDIENMLRQ